MFYTAKSVFEDYFLVGDPSKHGQYVYFVKNRQIGNVLFVSPGAGVFDDYIKCRRIPKWVKPYLTKLCISQNKCIYYQEISC